MRMAADRFSVRWYTGYGLDEPLPDHSTLTRIRERYGLEIFRRFFDAIVQPCIDEELVWGKEFYIDATKVQDNASAPPWRRLDRQEFCSFVQCGVTRASSPQ